MAERSGLSALKVVLIALGVCAVLVLGCCAVGGVLLWRGTEEVREIASLPPEEARARVMAKMEGWASSQVQFSEEFTALLDEGAFEEAHALTSTGLQAIMTLEDLRKLHGTIARVMGPLRSLQLSHLNTKVPMGGATVYELTYAATYANGKGTLILHLIEEGGGLRVQAYRVNSPLFLDALSDK